MRFNTNQKCYIVVYDDPSQKLEFQFVPNEATWNRQAKIGEIEIVGRNNPQQQWTGGSDSFAFTLDFYCEDASRKDVTAKCEFLQSLTYANGNTAPPPLVKIVWGEWFRNEKWVLRSCNTVYSTFYKGNGYLPHTAKCDLSFTLNPDFNRTLADIRRNY